MEITTKPFFFLSFFLHTWLYLLMTPASIMLVIPGLPSFNGVEVCYLKGVIGLPIVISFRDRWYIHIFLFFFGNGLIDDIIVIGWTDSDFKISRALDGRSTKVAKMMVVVWPFYGEVKFVSQCICMGTIHLCGKNVENFKQLLLRSLWANVAQISCGASLGWGNEKLLKWSRSVDQDVHHAHIW